MSEPPEIDIHPSSDANEAASSGAANELFTPAMRLLELQGQHRALDGKIAEMYEYPYLNQILLQRLKKEKLRLKDNIERLKNELVPDLNA